MSSDLPTLVIVGAGGFGREVVDIVDAINAVMPTFQLVGFLDDGDIRHDLLDRIGLPLVGNTNSFRDLDAAYVVGIGAADARRRVDSLAGGWDRRPAVLRHPAATLGRDVELGDGAIIAAGARLTTHIRLGRHAHVNIGCTVGHDTVIEDFATLFGGAVVGGGCVIGAGATVGSGAVILPGVHVGEDAMVGAGAIVVRDVAPGASSWLLRHARHYAVRNQRTRPARRPPIPVVPDVPARGRGQVAAVASERFRST